MTLGHVSLQNMLHTGCEKGVFILLFFQPLCWVIGRFSLKMGWHPSVCRHRDSAISSYEEPTLAAVAMEEEPANSSQSSGSDDWCQVPGEADATTTELAAFWQKKAEDQRLESNHHSHPSPVRSLSLPKEKGTTETSVVDMAFLVFIGSFVSTTGLESSSRGQQS